MECESLMHSNRILTHFMDVKLCATGWQCGCASHCAVCLSLSDKYELQLHGVAMTPWVGFVIIRGNQSHLKNFLILSAKSDLNETNLSKFQSVIKTIKLKIKLITKEKSLSFLIELRDYSPSHPLSICPTQSRASDIKSGSRPFRSTEARQPWKPSLACTSLGSSLYISLATPPM